MDYKTIKKLHDAQRLVETYARSGRTIKKSKKRTYNIPNNAYWYGKAEDAPLALSYSQQEITIYRSHVYHEYDTANLLLLYPTGVGRKYFRTIDKEYVSFKDAGGVIRNYVVPEGGLRIQKDGSGYKAINPIPDYRIEVDRAKAKQAREPAEEFYQYINTLWDITPELDYRQRPYNPPSKMPSMDDKDAWFQYISDVKNARWGRVSKETLMRQIRAEYTQSGLAYKITQVPDTETDSTEHWKMIDRLRRAGMLEKFEGPVKVKKQRGKQKAKAATSH